MPMTLNYSCPENPQILAAFQISQLASLISWMSQKNVLKFNDDECVVIVWSPKSHQLC